MCFPVRVRVAGNFPSEPGGPPLLFVSLKKARWGSEPNPLIDLKEGGDGDGDDEGETGGVGDT